MSKAEIIRLRKTNPCASLQKIGNQVHLSRERVRQVLHQAGLPTKGIKRPPLRYICLNCEQSFVPYVSLPSNRVKTPGYDHKSFCSRKCSAKYHVLTLTCEVCGITFPRPQSHLINNIRQGYGNHIFCSRTCHGKWAGNNFGFTAHPENARGNGRKRKWDYGQVWALQKKTGWGYCRLSRALGIPESTISYILAKVNAEKVLTTSP